MQKFSELKYTRPDIKAFKRRAKKLIEKFKTAGSVGEAKSVLREIEGMTAHLETMYVIASIRNNMDMKNKFYDEEMTWLQKTAPKLVGISKNSWRRSRPHAFVRSWRRSLGLS